MMAGRDESIAWERGPAQMRICEKVMALLCLAQTAISAP